MEDVDAASFPVEHSEKGSVVRWRCDANTVLIWRPSLESRSRFDDDDTMAYGAQRLGHVIAETERVVEHEPCGAITGIDRRRETSCPTPGRCVEPPVDGRNLFDVPVFARCHRL